MHPGQNEEANPRLTVLLREREMHLRATSQTNRSCELGRSKTTMINNAGGPCPPTGQRGSPHSFWLLQRAEQTRAPLPAPGTSRRAFESFCAKDLAFGSDLSHRIPGLLGHGQGSPSSRAQKVMPGTPRKAPVSTEQWKPVPWPSRALGLWPPR